MRIGWVGEEPDDEALRRQLQRMGHDVSADQEGADVVVAPGAAEAGTTPVVARDALRLPSFPVGVEAEAWAVLRACEEAVGETGEPGGPRVALWGTFDVENFGDLLFPRLFELELRRRIPEARIRFFSPRGTRVALDPTLEPESLGLWSFRRAAALAEELDVVVIGGGEIVHTHDEFYERWYGEGGARLRPSEWLVGGLGRELERICPVAWHAVGVPFDLDDRSGDLVRLALADRRYVSVRDEVSRERLRRLAPDRPIELVPDSAFLLDRLFPPEALAERRRGLQEAGSFPSGGRPLVVQGSVSLLPFADAVASAVAGRDVLLLSTGPAHGDDEFAAALAKRLPNAYRLGGGATVEDIAAALAGGAGYVGLSLHGTIASLVYGVPVVIFNPVGYTKLDGLAGLAGIGGSVVRTSEELPDAVRALDGATPPDVRQLAERVDRHFDALAAIARESASTRRAEASLPARLEHLALETADDRYALARAERDEVALELEASRRELAELRTATAPLRAQLEAAIDDAGRARGQLRALQSTKVFRYSAPLRNAYARLRNGRR